MGLFNFFAPKTVSYRYKKLMSLFEKSHRSFTITKKEKNIIEFTFKGFEPNTIQYWSIEQNFNTVTIFVHTKLDNSSIDIKKSFPQSGDQTIMYNTIMELLIKNVLSYMNESCNGTAKKEIEEGFKEDSINQKKNNSKTIIFTKSWKLLDFHKQYGKMQVGSFIDESCNVPFKTCIFTNTDGAKIHVYFYSELGELTPIEISNKKNELYVGKTKNGNYFLYSRNNKGWSMEEPTLKSHEYKEYTQESYNSLYDGSKTYEIDLLTVEQKIALFTLLTILAESTVKEDKKDDAADTIRYFANVLHLYNESINKNTFDRISSNKQECINIAKTITMDEPFIEFATACGFLKDTSMDKLSFSYKYTHLLMDIGFSERDAKDMDKGRYNYRFNS